MAVARFIAVALIFIIVAGCQSFMKDDPIMGDHPWKPGSSPPPQKDHTDGILGTSGPSRSSD